MSLPISIRLRGIPVALLLCATAACAKDEPVVDTAAADSAAMVTAPVMATTMITMPAEGASVPAGDVHVMLEAQNIAIMPASDSTTANSGHHHLFLNQPVPAVGEAIPAGQPGIVHLGMAQTDYTFTALPAGEYTLIDVVGDHAHHVLEQMSDTLHFTVTAP